MFGRKRDIYCQACGRELTSLGGRVDEDAKTIICMPRPTVDSEGCISRYASRTGIILSGGYHNPKRVQRDIRRGRLVYYGPLEQTSKTKQ
jgi:hypothetical protein